MEKIVTLNLKGTNSYLVESEGQFLLIDTGGPMFTDRGIDSKLEVLKKGLQENGVTKDNLKLVVLTHGDCDHVYNAAYIKREYGAMVAIHEKDAVMVLDTPPWDIYKANCNFSSAGMRLLWHLMEHKAEKLMKKIYQDFESVTPDFLLEEGMSLEKYGFDFNVYHTPGHTPGSCCFLDKEGNLFCGDLFNNTGKNADAMNAVDFDVLKIHAKRMRALPVKTIYPGHGKPFENKEDDRL